jgi:hypothetical protein
MAYFCLPETDEHDLTEGLYDASCVIKTIQAFCIGIDNPFEGFATNTRHELHGLNVIFDCVTHAIDTARDELSAERRADWERKRATIFTADDVAAAVRQERDRTIKMFETLKSSFDAAPEEEEGEPAVPPEALSAREVAIKEAVRKGYAVEDIAQAVNLKKAAVQRIISRLRTTGDLPANGGEQAASA